MPLTRVDFVSADRDPLLGTVRLTIVGRGFTENGTVRKIYLDRGHKAPPWDLEFDPERPVTVTDRAISGIVLDSNRESGAYRIGLLQERASGPALYFTPDAMFTFASPGTVKIGNFQLLLPRWVGRQDARIRPVIRLPACFPGCHFSGSALLPVDPQDRVPRPGRGDSTGRGHGAHLGAAEHRVGGKEKADADVEEERRRPEDEVHPPHGHPRRHDRPDRLRSPGIPDGEPPEAGARHGAAEQREYPHGCACIERRDPVPLRYRRVCRGGEHSPAANGHDGGRLYDDHGTRPQHHPRSLSQGFRVGERREQFRLAADTGHIPDSKADREGRACPTIPSLQKQIDADAQKKFTALIDEYRTLQGQANELRTKTDAASKIRLAAVSVQLGQKSAELDTLAKAEYAHFSTLEPFNATGRLRPTYLFYKPIIYYNRAPILADTSFYQGMVRLEVKTDAITRQINESIGAILKIAGSIALAAIALGVLGAIIMASITVTPIRKLAQGVAKIRDTEKKETLKDHTIVVNTRDEIGELADTVNTMTQGLVKAAIANNELLAGIDVQKRFLPLVKGVGTAKGSTAEEENDKVEVYGYYRGAKGVSGDYFDFKKLDDTHYALIKCDVAGKGVSAALIMVEVATIFISYFRDWVKRKESIALIKDPKAKLRAVQELDRIDSLVYTINDMVEERGFPGRFAAFTVCILNSATGATTVCNAGDTIINVYEAEQKKMVHNQLPEFAGRGHLPLDARRDEGPLQAGRAEAGSGRRAVPPD